MSAPDRASPRPLPAALRAAAAPLLLLSAAGGAQDAARPPPLEEVVVSAPEPRYVAPTTRDRIGRIWAPVLLNGRGPYRFVLDTGASRSAITGQVVEELGLPVKVDSARLRGMTGTRLASTVDVATLEVGELLVENTRMPIVADAFGGAQGVLGGEGFRDKRIVIEFHKDRISIMRSNRLPAATGFTVLPFKASRHRGMRVDVRVGPVKAVAMIDTGAQMTVGNLALRDALARRAAALGEHEVSIVGVTEDVQTAEPRRIPSIVAGDLIVRNAGIAFSDLYIFDYWRIRDTPALLISMDVLGVLDTLIIDYRLGELQIRTQR